MREIHSLKKAYFAGIIFSFLVGFSFLGIKVCTRDADPIQILTIRYDFAMLAVLMLLLFRVRHLSPERRSVRDLLIAGGTYVGFMVFQTIGLYSCTSVESAILFAIVPVMVNLIARPVLKERSTRLQIFFMILSVAALILMICMGAARVSFSVFGFIMLLLASVSMACSNVAMRLVRNRFSPYQITFTICLMGCLLFNVISWIRCARYGNLQWYTAPLHSGSFLLATAYLGIGCILLSAQLMAYMQSRLPATNASIFGNVSTVISVLAGVLFLHEPLRWYHLLCGTLVVGGAVGINLTPGHTKKEK